MTNVPPRISTLDIIARYLGYDHWESLRAHDIQTENSSFDERDECLPNQFPQGQKVQVSYLPNRKLILEYVGDYRFRVIESENSKLKTGDELTLTHLLRGYPLMASDVVRDGNPLGSFTAGKAQGIDFKLL